MPFHWGVEERVDPKFSARARENVTKPQDKYKTATANAGRDGRESQDGGPSAHAAASTYALLLPLHQTDAHV
jgi:hypothetical protein